MMEKIDHKLVVLWLVFLTSLGAAAKITGENEEKHHVRGWMQDAIESQSRTSISTGRGTGRRTGHGTGRSTGHGKGNATEHDARHSAGQGKGHSSGHGKRRCKGHITGQTSVQDTTTAKVPTTSEYNQPTANHVPVISEHLKSARKVELPTFSAEQFLKDWEKRQIEIEQKRFEQNKETSSDASAHVRDQQNKETSSDASAHGRDQQRKQTRSDASAQGRDQQKTEVEAVEGSQKTEVEAVDGSQKTEVEAVDGPLSSKKSNEGSSRLKGGKPTPVRRRPSRVRHDADDVAKFFEHRYNQLLTLNN
ncbi:unnamed protein product [Lymnaea stagnalis]|uniref:Uncharacterized protein n=1 Tax=Lymnaea stagnalis TaxID=6523 RepID=A0AAV2GZM0_LYMST